MFGIRYLKTAPTTYVLHYKDGRARREGAGASFFYYAPSSTIVAVPLATVDAPFVFNETTADYQPVTIQGQLSFRVVDPKRLAGLLDYSVHPDGSYRSEDPEILPQRLIHAAQVETRAALEGMDLRKVLAAADRIAVETMERLKTAEPILMLGVEILGFSILSLKPTPEMSKALEAEAREALQRRADGAIYARRNAAVEEERKIKESELQTELAVEAKKRQIREAQMAAEIAVEEQRSALIVKRVENDRQDSDSRAYALRTTLEPLKTLDWKTLMCVAAGGADPKLMIALAFRELAENAQKIGELNVSPDLLQTLLKTEKK